MDEEKVAAINVVTDIKVINVSYHVGSTTEYLCIKICKQIGIGPVARHLFALRNPNMKYWYPSGHILLDKEKYKFDFRLRFKPSSLKRLRQIDAKAYDYYFLQARHDVLNNKVPDIIYEEHKRELFGLGVTDMYRVMIEKGLARDVVESDYKKYIPKECIKRHAFFIKKPIHQALSRISGHDASYVKEQYLDQFQSIAPNYPCEEYEALMFKSLSNPPLKVVLRVNSDEIKYCEVDGNIWNTLCTIEDLYLVTIGHDNTAEISRKNGIPPHLKFSSNAVLMSFVSVLDGYYRLTFKWTFNLCGDVITPSLEILRSFKCHGPVGGEFSYAKLKDKCDNKPGTFILRECETSYNNFYIDVCAVDRKARTYKIEKLGPEEFLLSVMGQKYKSFKHLIMSNQDFTEPFYLNECLPPSEYDNSPLLMCAPERTESDVAADEKIITDILSCGPQIISPVQLQIYEGQSFAKSRDTMDLIGSTIPKTTLYRAMWRVAKGKKLETAIRLLKDDEKKYLNDFLDMAGKWSHLRSDALVRMYGVTLPPVAGMLLELVKLGPLDAYLRNTSPNIIKTVDMVEAALCLATAVSYLEESRIVHGSIRCRKLLVHQHTESSFVVKLADPGLFSYTFSDIHWLPPECYANPNSARYNTQADVWALATTLWEIFSRGAQLPIRRDIESIKKFYASGKRLPIPNGCPPEVYDLMIKCWGELGGLRKAPHVIMRDIKRIHYQVYNSKRMHSYATVFPKLFNNIENMGDKEFVKYNSSTNSESRASSLITDDTTLTWDNFSDITCVLEGIRDSSSPAQDSTEDLSTYLDWLAENVNTSMQDNGIGCNRSTNNGLFGRMQSIFELDADCNVILQGRIGQGFYGEVYLGMLERDGGEQAAMQQVAVKKLKMRAVEQDLQDFEREIDIMKSLRHPNIVEILGIVSEPEVCLVMEFVRHGSLQSYLSIHRENLSHKKLLGFALDIATGMNYLGSKSIVHRDLAARNILVADENCVKISDFGLAQVTGKNDYYILQTNRDLPIKWYAPESLSDGKFSVRSDVWSYGVTMYETFTFGEDPNLPGIGNTEEEGSSEILAALERGTRLPCPSDCPQNVYAKLMHPCWHLDSRQRPNFATLCSDIRNLILEF